MITKDFKYFTSQIDQQYQALPELKWDWRFSYGLKETFYDNNGILLIGLNPGGGQESRTDILPSFEEGNAYIFEEWGYAPGKNPLQKQVVTLFTEIADKINSDHVELMNNSFTSNIIPFRSPNLETLPHKKEVVHFSTNMWHELSNIVNPNLIITIGNSSSCSAYSILKKMYSKKEFEIEEEEIPINWGNYKTYASALRKDEKEIVMIGLPHLSTFKFIGRESSRNATEIIVKKIAAKLKQ